MQTYVTKKWLLARTRTIRAGVMLIVAQMDELGMSLANDSISPEQAAHDLEILETLPVYFAAHILTPVDDTAATIIRQWEAADAKRPEPPKPTKPEYQTPKATINAFWHLVRQNDQAHLARWLSEHPRDSRYLQKLWRIDVSRARGSA